MRSILVFLAALLLCGPSSRAQICTKSQLPVNLQNGLIAFYPFCGNANDASGNGNNGTVNGATLTTDRFGILNNAYSFNGSGNYINVPFSNSLGTIQNKVTVSAWLYMDGGGCSPRVLQLNSQYSNCGGVHFSSVGTSNNSRYFSCIFDNCTAGIGVNSNIQLSALSWHHVVFVSDGSNGTAKIYFDGVLAGENLNGTTFNSISYDGSPLTIGNINPSRCDWWGGKLDDILLYNRALTACEISQLYSATSTSIPPLQTLNFNPLSDTTSACGTSKVLDAGPGFASYQWNNGATSQSITATSGGFYKVTVTNAAGCSASDSTVLSLVNANILNSDTTICKGSSITLSIDSLFPRRTACTAAELPSNLRNGLVGYWPFCGNANDASGNGNNGVVNGATLVADRFGTSNSSYKFNGIDNLIDFGNLDYISTGISNEYTISFWLQVRDFNTPATGGQSFLFGDEFAQNNGVAIQMHTQNGIGVYTAGSPGWYSGFIPLRIQWNQYVIKQNSTGIFLYINGIFHSVLTTSINSETNTNTRVGLFTGCSGPCLRPLDGCLDDLIVWNRCLSDNEILQSYISSGSVTWSTGATTNSITVSPTQTTTYYVTVSDGITTCTDSVKVTVSEIANFNPLSDTTRVCGKTTTLDAGPGFAGYQWNNGATTQSITATSGGFYKVTVTNAAGCSASDSTFLSLVNANIINNDTSICKGSSITLSIDSLFPGRTACTAAGLPANLSNGLVGYWPFCGNANDASGNGSNGVVNGATLTMDRFGMVNSAYNFRGAFDDKIYGNLSVPVSNSFTFSCWAKHVSGSIPTKQWIFAFGTPTDGNATQLGVSNGIVRMGSWGLDGLPTNATISTTWNHYVITCQNGFYSIWQNGILVNSNLFKSTNITGTAFEIGNQLGAFTQEWDGKIDDILLWNRVLQPSEINTLFTPSPTITWSTGTTANSITVSPTQTTTYYVTVTDGITTCTDSVKVTISTVDTAVVALDPVAICATGSGQVRLQATGAAGYTYQWLFNGVAILNSNVRTYTATQSGNYRAVLTNALGCRDSSRTITINVVPTPTVNAISNQTACNGTTVTATPISGSVVGAVYTWVNNTPSIGLAASGTGNIPAFTATNTGSTPVVATITITPSNTVSGQTCTGTPITFTITVNPTPTIAPVTNQSVCNGLLTSAINFSGAVSGTTYSWINNTPSIGLAASGTGNIGAFTATNTTANPVTATITVTPSANNCTGTPITFTITVNPTPVATIANPSTTNICQGSSVTLTASGGTTYQWYLNGNLIPGATGATYAATQAGIYTVVPTSAFNCRGVFSNAITLGLIARPTADFTFDKYCAGFPTNFTNLSQVNGSGVVGYAWTFGDGGTSTLVNPSHVYAQTGTYNATLLVTPLACPALTSTITKPVAIQPPPANIRYPSVNAVVNRNLQLQARVFTGAVYQWVPPTGLNNSGIQTPIFNYNQQQQYLINITTPDGCVVRDTLLVRMFAQREIYVPTTFTPNGDGANDRLIPRLVGIADLIYFRVYDRWGQLMYQTTNENEGWDGTYKGVKQPMETYAWMAEGKDIDGNIIKRSGTTVLLR